MNTFDPKHRYSDAAKLARLKNKKLFLFDIDGTIAVGDTLYEGSAELIRYINAIGGRAYYITNNSTKSGLDYVKKFHDAFHLDSTEDQFITSGYMTLRFLKENYAEKKIFVLGTASFVAELRKNGLHAVRRHSWRKLRRRSPPILYSMNSTVPVLNVGAKARWLY